jgi:RNA chaperone Hfq
MQTRTSIGRDFQDQLLERLADRRQVATIYLRNRMSLRGRILEFDPYVFLLEPLDGSPPQLVYKSAIVAVSGPPRRPGPPRRGPGGPREYGPREGGPREYGPRDYPPRAGAPHPPDSADERPSRPPEPPGEPS